VNSRSLFPDFVLTVRCALLCAWLFFCSPLGAVSAQTDHRQQFNDAVKAWKQCAKDAIVAGQEFLVCDKDEAEALRKEWIRAIAAGRDTFESLVKIGLERAKTETAPDPELLSFLAIALELRHETGNYEAAYEMGKQLLELSAGPGLIVRQCMSAFATNRFEECRAALNLAQTQFGGVPPDLAMIARALDSESAAWERELKLREAEAKADDLPRVELSIRIDEIVHIVTIELFENEAPNAVANFISLVERGFYNDRAFFRVTPHGEAAAGCPNDDGTGGPGYSIRSEFSRPEARKHFRGSVGMVNMNRTGREGSQFYINYTPNPELDGRSTVIGRVLTGQEVIDGLPRTHMLDETGKKFQEMPRMQLVKIESARVLRKRNHDYLPEKIVE
jgi:cyclophilin family peptidyl-prolyl cis-trans isomerase